MDKCFQPSRRVGFLHQFLDQRHTGENDALTSPGDVWEETVFDGIVLGTVGWIVSNAYFNPDFIGQRLQVLLEQVVTGTVATAAIAQDKNGGGVGVKLAAVGIPPVAKAITGEFTGVMAVAQVDVAHIELQVIEAVGKNSTPTTMISTATPRASSFPTASMTWGGHQAERQDSRVFVSSSGAARACGRVFRDRGVGVLAGGRTRKFGGIWVSPSYSIMPA